MQICHRKKSWCVLFFQFPVAGVQKKLWLPRNFCLTEPVQLSPPEYSEMKDTGTATEFLATSAMVLRNTGTYLWHPKSAQNTI